jgi:hypothetical protein
MADETVPVAQAIPAVLSKETVIRVTRNSKIKPLVTVALDALEVY